MSISQHSQNIQLDTKRHSFAHILAAAVKDMFPDAQFGIGPVIENGCFYDFILPRTLIPEDLPLIQKKIKKLLSRQLVFKVQELSIEDALAFFDDQNQPLKVELLQDLKNRGTTNLKEEEKEVFSSDEVLLESEIDKIDQLVKRLQSLSNELIKHQSENENEWYLHFQDLILKLNDICTKNYVSRNIEIDEPVLNFEYKRKMGGKFIESGKVSNIFDLIKYYKTIISHQGDEGKHLITFSNSTVKDLLISNSIIFGKCKAISFGDSAIESKYHDDILVVNGQGQLYLNRHIATLVNKLLVLKNNSKKVDWKNDLHVTLYRIVDNQTGETVFADLCKGPHISEMKELRGLGFKLDKFSAAYWRGDQDRGISMQRLYALVFETKDELKDFIFKREEAKKRDHRVLNSQQKYYTISELVGAGLPLMQPNGMKVRKLIQSYLWQLHSHKGYQEVWTPHIAKQDLYETSGHAAKFGDELFRVKGKSEDFIMKPMNCPHHMQIFADNQFSYRDMPVRYFEHATVYRDEKPGQLSGFTRVRSITQDDGHLFCRTSQIKEEVSIIVGIIREFYATMGMEASWVSLSVRDPQTPEKYLGSNEVWENAENALEEAAKENSLNYERVEGEAAFYGPKLDFMFRDCLDREWQLATIQCDFNLPEKFKLSFTNEHGEDERPVVIHRAISGSVERFMGVIIDHFGGKFPFWLAPEQIRILTINDEVLEYVSKITSILDDTVLMKPLKYNELRYTIDKRSESLGKKIREAKLDKIPMHIIVGQKDVDAHQVSIEYSGESIKIPLSQLSDYLSKL